MEKMGGQLDRQINNIKLPEKYVEVAFTNKQYFTKLDQNPGMYVC